MQPRQKSGTIMATEDRVSCVDNIRLKSGWRAVEPTCCVGFVPSPTEIYRAPSYTDTKPQTQKQQSTMVC